MKSYDAVVVGGGPAGIAAALYLLRFGVEILMVEKLSPGGQVLLSEEVENYPGFPKSIKGWELADALAAHLEPFQFDRISDEVKSIEPGDGAHVLTIGDTQVQAKSVVLCSGARYRKLGVPGEVELTGKGVSYCALCDGNFFRDQPVVVVGGGNSALEESLYLARICSKVTLIHRRDAFRGEQHYVDKVHANPKIELVLNSVVNEIVGGEQGVTGVRVENCATGEKSSIDTNAVFIFVGFVPVIDFVHEDVKRDGVGLITDTEMRTNVPGIFAAGDCRSKLCRQIVTAVGDGATAANACNLYLESLHA